MSTVSYTKTLPVRGHWDVIIAGGGPAGIGAAVAAAEKGAKTLVIERGCFLGGMATAGFVNPMSEFCYNGEWVTGGIPRRFGEALVREGAGFWEMPRGNLSFDPERYKLVAQRMVLAAGAEIALETELVDCLMDGERISGLVIHDRTGLGVLEVDVYIDATGDAVLAALAGVPMLPDSRPAQPASLCWRMANVDTTTERMHIIHLNKHGVNHQAVFVRETLFALREAGERVPLFGGPWLCTTLQEGCITINMSRSAVDATDAADYAKKVRELTEDVYTLADLLIRHVPEFKNAYVSAVAPSLGIRQSRRIRGLYTLTGRDYLDGVQFKDSVARACHPVDIHLPGDEGQKLTFPLEAAYIPYRTMCPERVPNLLAAGRCVSADEDAFAAIRVQAPCMELGQAAGFAAAMAVQAGCAVQDVDRNALVYAVRRAGSFV